MDGAGKATSLTEALPLSLSSVPRALDHWASAHALEESGWQAEKSSRMFLEVEKGRDVLLRLALDWSLAWSELGEPQGLICCLLEACQAGVQGSGILPDYTTQNSPSAPAAPPSPRPPTQIERSYA